MVPQSISITVPSVNRAPLAVKIIVANFETLYRNFRVSILVNETPMDRPRLPFKPHFASLRESLEAFGSLRTFSEIFEN